MKKHVPKIGDEIYVDTHLYISHGSDDVIGGIAKVANITNGISGGKKCLFIEVEEHPGHSYNWTQFLSKEQDKLRKEFGQQRAHAYPDIDRPWLEPGDIIEGGEIYKGPPIW